MYIYNISKSSGHMAASSKLYSTIIKAILFIFIGHFVLKHYIARMNITSASSGSNAAQKSSPAMIDIDDDAAIRTQLQSFLDTIEPEDRVEHGSDSLTSRVTPSVGDPYSVLHDVGPSTINSWDQLQAKQDDSALLSGLTEGVMEYAPYKAAYEMDALQNPATALPIAVEKPVSTLKLDGLKMTRQSPDITELQEEGVMNGGMLMEGVMGFDSKTKYSTLS